jgi:NTP pyrophosphatase (non-canonical NTP hydrolase)
MHIEMGMVAEFMQKHGFDMGLTPGDKPRVDLVRSHLIAEELGELILAIADNNRVNIADALGDLLYVVIGAALVYNIPLREVFHEIHHSNMSKKTKDPNDERLRDKGPDYRPPDIKRIIDDYDNWHSIYNCDKED